MRLEKIDIKGFKSFAEATTIYFQKPVTGIVGPNGSGKSNIVDAFRWVLGEQKGRHLRLDQMSDVIFNGSAKRRPARFARVELTFSNTKNILPIEYQTVCISRELDAKGNSQYQINGVTCRLKDIHNLFTDTGIGPDSYAIIALQMVENLLQNRNHDRRNMFEQAAGISKYKARKKETLSKLRLAEGDLDRVDDLLHEIDQNLKSLEKQARRARKYKKLQAEFRELSLEVAGNQLFQYRLSIAQLQEKLLEAKEALVETTSIKTDQEAKLQADKKTLLDQEKNLSQEQKKYNEFLDQLRQKESQKSETNSQLQILKDQSTQAQKNVEQATQEIEKHELELVDLETLMSENSGRLHDTKAQREKAKEAFLAKEKEMKEHKTLRQRYVPSLKSDQEAKHQLEKRMAVLTNELAKYETNAEHIKQQKVKWNQELGRFRSEKQEGEKKLALLKAQREDINAKLHSSQKDKETRLEKLEACTKKLATLLRSLDARKNELDLLQSMIDNLEGFPESIKYLKKNKAWKADATLFTDIINVQDEVRTAIESYLEPLLNHFVVQNHDEALAAIEILQGAQKGKAQIFVLSRIAKLAETPRIEGMQRAVDCIEIESQYERLVHSLLYKVYIAPYEVARGYTPAAEEVILSQDGRLIQTARELRGGSIGLFQGKKLGRQKQLKELKSRIEELQLQKSDLEREKHQLSLDPQQGTIQEYQSMLTELDRNIQDMSSDMRLVQRKEEEATSRLDELQKQEDRQSLLRTQQEEESAEIRSKMRDLSQKIAKQIEAMSQADLFLSQNEDELNALRSAANHSEIEMIKVQGAMEKLQQDSGFRQKRILELNVVVNRAENELHSAHERMESLARTLEGLEQILQKDRRQKEEYSSGISAKEEEYYKLRASIHDREIKISALQDRYLKKQSKVNNLTESISNEKYKVRNILDRAQVEFKVDLSQLEIQELSKDEIKDKKHRRDKIAYKLENYGEVNPLAVVAYEEMTERKTHIESEKNDILEGQKNLLKTIEEIDATAKKKFMEAFMAINAHFKTVFRSLFGAEDDCQLLLTDPEDPLESSIEIIAKPKGKKPKSLSQLSGGEKTLTATALLFSLYLLKPAPFCIFDEVDAPLDDANIRKFNRIIKEFSKDSQFVIITHNKQTMVAMDVVYGVFMDQPGVSQVGGVDFNEIDYAQTA